MSTDLRTEIFLKKRQALFLDLGRAMSDGNVFTARHETKIIVAAMKRGIKTKKSIKAEIKYAKISLEFHTKQEES